MIRRQSSRLILWIALTIIALILSGCGTGFESSVWKAAREDLDEPYVRLDMADDLIARQSLLNKTKDQVLELLGMPDYSGSTPRGSGYFREYDLVYWLGPERGWLSIDSEWLVIKLDERGQVKDYLLMRD